MRAQATVHKVPIEADLERLDKFLMSDRSPPGSMMLSELDGFLTGIAIGPELVRPSEWLPLIWGGNEPEFADLDEANAILGSLMLRYNAILREIADDALFPIFWVGRDGTVIAGDWAEGFLRAIMLRADAWKPLFTSERDSTFLLPILALCCDKSGGSLLDLTQEAEDRLAEGAQELIPGCAVEIAAYWRSRGPRPTSLEAGWRPSSVATKVGRNDACPCGSGKKFKKCCGQVA